MEVKKSEKASLQNKRLLFVEIGFVVALLAVLLAFEWSSKEKADTSLLAENLVSILCTLSVTAVVALWSDVLIKIVTASEK